MYVSVSVAVSMSLFMSLSGRVPGALVRSSDDRRAGDTGPGIKPRDGERERGPVREGWREGQKGDRERDRLRDRGRERGSGRGWDVGIEAGTSRW